MAPLQKGPTVAPTMPPTSDPFNLINSTLNPKQINTSTYIDHLITENTLLDSRSTPDKKRLEMDNLPNKSTEKNDLANHTLKNNIDLLRDTINNLHTVPISPHYTLTPH